MTNDVQLLALALFIPLIQACCTNEYVDHIRYAYIIIMRVRIHRTTIFAVSVMISKCLHVSDAHLFIPDRIFIWHLIKQVTLSRACVV